MKIHYLLFSAALLLVSCSESTDTKNEVTNTPPDSLVTNEVEEVEELEYKYSMVSNLNVRPTPGIQGEVIYQLGENEKVALSGESSEETFKATFRGTEYDKPWVKIKATPEIEGWVHSGALVDKPVEVNEKLTAEYYDSPEKRKNWWQSQKSDWKRVFNIMVLNKRDNEYATPNDTELQKLFNAKEMFLGADAGCGEYNYEFELEDFSGLKCLTNLESLEISGMKTTDLTPISHLKNLTSLHAQSCGLKTLAGIGSLKKLKSLYVSYNEINTLKHLIGLTEVKTIFAESNKISSLDGTRNLKNLHELVLSYNPVKTFDGIERFTNLTSLTIERCELENLAIVDKLTGLKKLTYLSIKSNNIETIEPLSKLKNLETVNIGYIQLNSLKGIEHVKNIHKVYEYQPDSPAIPKAEIERVKELGIEVYEQEEICGC